MHTYKHTIITLSLTTLLAIFFTIVGLVAASVNTAPDLDNSGAPYFDTIFQDDSDPAGTRVSDMLATGAGGDPISDDPGAVEGIAVVAVDNASGTWQFSTDNGGTWTSFPTDTFAASLDLSTLTSGSGLTIDGSSVNDQAGWSVANAGDVNGDGRDDIIIGANQAAPGGKNNAGAGYVIFGTNQISATLDLSSLDGSNGFVLTGSSADDYAGHAVSGAGDINNDGYDDVIISAPDRQAGTVYVVFGGSSPFSPASLDLGTLDGSNGFVLNGIASNDKAGYSVSEAGDVNGDNIDDIIIGAFQASQSYVIFGSDSDFPASLDLSSLGSSGFTINGKAQSDWAGFSVSGAGDVDGDGFDDLLVGATDADPNGVDAAGEAYLLFGQSSFTATFNLSNLDGSSGVTFQGAATWDKAGWSVSGAGDINGDGLSDVIISAAQADNVLTDTGKSYVVFGHSRPFSATLALDALDGSDGFVLNGSGADDYAGQSVSGAGDLNGDGLADLIVGAKWADPNGRNNAGAGYVIFGSHDPFPAALELSSLDGVNGYVIKGAAINDQAGYAVSGGGDFDGDGLSDLIIGAPHSSAAAANGGRSFVVFSRPGVTTLYDTAKIRFVPNTGFTGSASLLFRAWDTTDGHASGDTGVQIGGTGGSFAYSSAVEQASITVLPPPPDLVLVQTIQPTGLVLPGQTITYTLSFSNSGVATAHNVVLTDVIPAALGNLSVANSGVPITPTGSQSYVWQIGNLPVGSGGTIVVSGEISPDLAADVSFTNVATLAGSELESDTANNSASKTTNVALPRVDFDSANFSVTEIAGTAIITARLNIASGLSVAVDYATTTGGTASPGSDYSAISGTLTFSPNTKVQTFSVPILDDSLDETNETIALTLSNPNRAVLATPYQATLTIINDDQTITGLQAANSSPTVLTGSTAFTASVSAGNSVGYVWDFGDGATGSGANAAHTYSAAGSYTAVVTATNAVNQVTATTSVSIREAVAGLVASNNGPVQLGQAATMTATTTAGTGVTYSWDFGDGATGSGSVAAHTYTTVGSHIATVTADNGVSSQSAQTTIVVNDVPLAGLQATNNGPKPMGQAVDLNATIATGSNDTYIWDFGDSTSGSGASVSHSYHPQQVGVYTATVTASNSLGSLTATTVVSITDIPITGLAVRSNSPRIFGQTIDLTATVTAGSNVSYVWDLDDGSGPVSGSTVAGYLYAAPGNYNVTVTATNGVDSDVATVLVAISPRTCWVRLNNDPTDYFYVQAAVDASTSPSDVVKVAGTCTGVSEITALNGGNSFRAKQIVALTKNLTLRGGYTVTNWSSYDWAANPTTLDAQGQGRVIYVTGSVSPLIEGLKLTGGNASGLGGSVVADVGGGVFVDTANPVLRNNDISNNSAEQGGGLWLLQSSAVISQNTISNNTVTGAAADGAGLYLYLDASTIISNTISGNSAELFGGGVRMYQGTTLFKQNTVSGNNAQDGAGVYMWNSTATLEQNTITTNDAAGSGGGLYLHNNAAAISKNTFHGNTAASGGGLYLYNDQTNLDGNTITANQATKGGGFYLNKSDAILANTFVIDNQAISYGSGFYILGAQPKIYHATIASNNTGDGVGLYVLAEGSKKSNVQIKNSILVDHVAGIHVEATSQASLEATLWGSGSWANSDDWTGSGTISTDTTNIWADPGFADPASGDYHLVQGSAALDQGVTDAGVTTDFDGYRRPSGGGYDLGADELPIALNVLHTAAPNPAAPGTELTYTLLVTNSDSISTPVTIVFTPPASVTPNSAYTWNTSLTAGGLWSTQLTATVSNGASGLLVSNLEVTDDGGQTITNQFSLDVQRPISGLTLSNDGPTVLNDITTMTATASGDSISYAWDLGDGQISSGPVVTNIYAAVGSYTVVVTASNGVGDAVDSMTVLVEKKVSGLAITASSPFTKSVAADMSATVSQGSNVAYSWDFGDGQSGSGAAVTHTYTAVGNYTVVVTAGNQVSLVTRTKAIEVQETVGGLLAANDGPTELNQTTALTATVTAGNKVTYSWNFGDGQTGSGPTVSHKYGAVGSYVATVTASNGVSSRSQSTTVIVTDIPITGLTATNTSPTVLGTATTLNASTGAGSNVSYSWDFGDGHTGSGPNVSHAYQAIGSYTAVVTASNAASTYSAATAVTVVDQPVSGLSFNSSSPDNLGQATTFNASKSAGTNVVYSWAFGDGTQIAGSGQNTSHTYSAGGTYSVTLTAANSAGSATASGLVTINRPPVALLSLSAYTGTLDTPITADASGSSDPEGSSLTYTFDFGGQKTVGPQSSPTATHTFANSGGTFTIQVTVSDGQMSSSASRTVDIGRIPKLAIDKQGPARVYTGDLITYTLIVTNMTLPPGSTSDAILQVSPTTLNFSATEGGSTPAPQSFSISNGGSGSLAWLVRESAGWLILGSTNGSGPASVSASVDISGLPVGVYTEKIIVDAGQAQDGRQEIDATLTLFCAGRQPVDVVLALDRSGSMYGSPFTSAQAAVKKFIGLMDLSTDQVGLVSFNDIATIDQTLTRDGAAVQATVDGLYASGMTDIAEAISDAHSELVSSRRNSGNSQVIILLSDGTQTVTGDPLLEAAQAKADGLRIISIGLGYANTSILQAVASAPGDYYYAPSAGDLSLIYNRIAVEVGCPGSAASLSLQQAGDEKVDPFAPVFRTFPSASPAETDEATAYNLVISDTIPAGATYVAGGTRRQGNVVYWDITEPLSANTSVEVTFAVAATGAVDPIVNDDYAARADGGYSATGTRPVITLVQPRPIPPVPDITLTLQASDTSVQGTQTVTYSYLIQNTGTATLTNIALKDSQLGLIGGVETLLPNETLSLQESAVIIDQTTNVATVTADSTYGAVSDSQSVTVNFVPVVPCGATIQSVGDGDWKDAATWSPAHIPDNNDIVLVNAGHTVIIQASAQTNIQSLCNYGVLRSTDKQMLHINAHGFLFNYGAIESTAGDGGSGNTCGKPANDLKLDGRPIINWGTIQSGDGGDGDKCGGRGGSVMVRGLNTTNYGTICAGKGGNVLGSTKNQSHGGKGGDTSVWGNHGGAGMLLNTGLICAGDGGDSYLASSDKQQGGDGGDLRLISEPDVILSGGRYYAGDGGLGAGGGDDGKDGRVFIEPTVIALAGPNTEVKGGDIIIFGGADWVLDLSNMNGAAIKASGSITLAVGAGGKVDLRHNGAGSDVLQAGGQVYIAADTIETDSGTSLAEVVGGPVTTGPGEILKDVSLNGPSLVEGLPGVTLPISLTVMNGGPENDSYTLSQQNSGGWTVSNLPSPVAINGLDTRDLALAIDVPAAAQGGEQNVITFTATSTSDPNLVTTAVVEVEVAGSGGGAIYLPIVIK